VERRVPGVEHPVQVTSGPIELNPHRRAEGVSDGPERLERQLSRSATLEAADELPSEVKTLGHVLLSPPLAEADDAERRTDLAALHNTIITTRPYLLRSGVLSATRFGCTGAPIHAT
jgi:hypothetical protein